MNQQLLQSYSCKVTEYPYHSTLSTRCDAGEQARFNLLITYRHPTGCDWLEYNTRYNSNN
jgi:hypothetical protein